MTDKEGVIDAVIVPRLTDLGDDFTVRRALPTQQRRMVGPFIFLDQMGPALFETGRGVDVRPHPHIGLATVTYLLKGEMLHRDSLGSVQMITPGDVNWMTAGRGIVHSERTAPETRRQPFSLYGLQSWVALPQRYEECAPAFEHIAQALMPMEEGEGVSARIVAGEYFGKTSPAPTLSPMCYVDIFLQPGARVTLPGRYAEQALYVLEGNADLGRDGSFEAGQLLVLKPGATVELGAGAHGAARVMLLGGEPMDGPRYISWNFVASSAERIEQAKADWQAGRFPAVPGETEFIPLPPQLGRPAHYP